MPDNNDIDNELQRAVTSILKAVNAGKTVSDTQLRNFLTIAGKASDGMDDVGFSAKKAAHSLKSTASGMAGFAGQLASGNTSFSVVNTAIRGVTDTLGNFAAMIPIVGDGLKGFTQQMGKAAEFSIEQIEAGYGAFGQLSDIGLIGSKGIKGLAEDFAEAGIPLKMYTGLLSNSSKQLAALTGTAHDASGVFAETMGQLRGETRKGINGIDNQLRLLGYSTEEIGETFINYADLQRRLGREQSMNSQSLKDGTAEYAKELDMISKLTGMSRKEQQKVVDAAMAESRWRATIQDMNPKQVQQMNNLNNGLSAFSGELAQGMRDQASGFTQSDAAQRLFRSTNGESARIQQRLNSGQITGIEALQQYQNAIKNNMDPMKSLAKATGNQAGIYTDYSKNMDFVTASMTELDKATKTQTAQTKSPDDITKASVKAVVALEDTNTKIASMFMNSDNAAIALEKFADVTNMAAEAAFNLFLSDSKNPATTRSASTAELSGSGLEQRKAQINAELDTITMPQMLPYAVSAPKAKFQGNEARVAELLVEMAKVTAELNKTNNIIKAEEKNRVSKLTSLNSIFKEYGLSFGSGGLSNNAYVVNNEGQSRSRVLGKGSEYAGVKGVNDVQAGEIKRLLDATNRKGFELTKRVDENDQLWRQIKELITRPDIDFNTQKDGIQDSIPETTQQQTDALNNMGTKLDVIAKNTDALVRVYNKNNQLVGMKG